MSEWSIAKFFAVWLGGALLVTTPLSLFANDPNPVVGNLLAFCIFVPFCAALERWVKP